MSSIGAMIRREIAPEDEVAHAQFLAERFDEIWIVEDLPFAGGISQLATVLAATDDVVVGHGIAPAPFRNPAALAMEWATLERMFPGRLRCGLGHGVQSWMRDIGEAVDSPLTLIDETHRIVHELLDGSTPEVDGRYRSISGWALEFPPIARPPISLGVVGPKSLALSGRIADGTVLGEGHDPDAVRRARTLIDGGRADAGRSDAHHLTVFVSFFVGSPEDAPTPPPETPVGGELIGAAADVMAGVAALGEAGADSVILVPLTNPGAQFRALDT